VVAWIERWHHDIVAVDQLPRPHELEHPPCMVGRGLRTRQPGVRDCCEYHNQDWGFASETAIWLLQVASGEGLTGYEAADRVAELAEADAIPDSDVDAIVCLVSPDDPLMLDDDGYIYGGRHRVQAMIDQGVKRTVLLRLELLHPETGLPA
jgi:hypothetical protein